MKEFKFTKSNLYFDACSSFQNSSWSNLQEAFLLVFNIDFSDWEGKFTDGNIWQIMEGDEVFTVGLSDSNPDGVVLVVGAASSVSLTIIEDESKYLLRYVVKFTKLRPNGCDN